MRNVGETMLLDKGKFMISYVTGMAGFFVPNLVAKMNPSMEINRNCEKVMMLPLPGNSLKVKKNGKKTV